MLDNKFTGWNIDVWFSIDELIQFITRLEQDNLSAKCSISAMSPDDFTLSLERINRKGDIFLSYSISASKFMENEFVRTTLSGGFIYDQEYLLTGIEDLKRFASVTKIQADIDFRFD